jgi:hypothetical protein
LQKASARCCSPWPIRLDSEQAGDVAGVALDLVEQAILALDAVELRKAR